LFIGGSFLGVVGLVRVRLGRAVGLLIPDYCFALHVELVAKEPDDLDASLPDADFVNRLFCLGHSVGETLLQLMQEGYGNWGEWWIAHVVSIGDALRGLSSVLVGLVISNRHRAGDVPHTWGNWLVERLGDCG
jgi:hypothetical protein